MRKRFQKQAILIVFIVILIISQTMMAFAADEISKGNYIFAMVLRSCGVCLDTSDGFLDQWRTAYESYLTSTGNQSLLNQLKAYDSLSWGANASGIQALRENVQGWLSSNKRLIENDGYGYSYFYLPTSSVSSPLPTVAGDVVVGLPRFSENQSLSSEDYSYLFSYSEVSLNDTKLVRRNVDVYLPKRYSKAVGFYNFGDLSIYSYWYGIRPISVEAVYSDYYVADGKPTGDSGTFSTGGVSHVNPQYLMNVPFNVACILGEVSSCYAGNNSLAVPKGFVPLTTDSPKAGISTKLIANKASVKDSMKLPSSSALAASCLSNTKKELELIELSSSLTAGGLEISYFVDYTVQHVCWLVDSNGGYIDWDWDNAQTETLSGILGTKPEIKLKDYPNYIFTNIVPSVEETEISENASFCVYYEGDLEATYPYTIEYYKENELFQSVSKTVPMFGKSGTTPRVVESCEDLCPEYYLPDSASSTSLPYTVSETNNVIKIHYQKDRSAVYPYTIEYYKDGEALKTISGTVPVFDSPVITSYENYCPEYYIVDDTMSTPLPYTVSKEDNVMKVYYEKDLDASYPYVVEYYKDGEVFETLSGTVPVFGDNLVSSCEDLCPQYYLPDNKRSTPLPFQVSKDQNTISIYYKRDLYAAFPYTVEYYQDGELFKTVPGSVSVFDPLVKSCISYCPKGYVLDSSLSTALPYEVSEEGGVVTCYYVKQDTVLPYTVEYYKDGLRMNTYSGNVPVSSPVVQSYPSYCPEYYKMDSGRSDTLPFTVSEGGSRIKVYYKKDEDAVFPYTVECYKNGELVETVSKTVSVFDPSVNEYGYECPEGYVVNTVSSTSLPYKVSKDSHVIRLDYIEKEISLPYTVEYYKDGKEVMTLSGAVAASSPVVESYWPYCPEGYLVDDVASDSLPFVVTESHNVIRVYCIPDPSNPYTSFTGAFNRLISFVFGVLFKSLPGLFFLIMLFVFIGWNFGFMKRVSSHATAKTKNKAGKPKKKRVFTASKSRFMKGVHANKGSSISSKARMRVGDRPGSLKSKANLANWKRY